MPELLPCLYYHVYSEPVLCDEWNLVSLIIRMGSLVLWKFSYAVRRDTASDIGKGDEALALNQAQNIFLRPRPSSARPFPTLEDRELGTPVLYNFCMPCPSSNHQGFPHVNVVQIPPA